MSDQDIPVKELPEASILSWENPPEPSNRVLNTDIIPFSEFTAMRKRIGGRNAFAPKTSFAQEHMDALKENPLMKKLEDDFVFSSYTMDPDAILFLMDVIEMFRPAKILELGSGLTTVLLADLQSRLTSNGVKTANFVSVDQDEEHVSEILELAEKAGLDVEQTIRTVTLPLSRYKIGDMFDSDDKAMLCYDFDEEKLHDALGGVRPDMIIIDGPTDEKAVASASMGKVLTMPILSLISAPGTLIVMNNMYGDPEIFAAEQWNESKTANIVGVKAVGRGMLVAVR